MLFILRQELLQAPLGLRQIGAEFESFLIIASCGLGHVLMLTLLAHHHIFYGKLFKLFLALLLLFLQGRNATSQVIYNIEFTSDEPLHSRLLYVVTTMYGQEEVIKRKLHVAPVEGFYTVVVFLVGLTLSENAVDELAIVVVRGEVDDLLLDEDLVTADGFLERQSLE